MQGYMGHLSDYYGGGTLHVLRWGIIMYARIDGTFEKRILVYIAV